MKKKRLLPAVGFLLLLAAFFYLRWDSLFPADRWTITQYGYEDRNAMFYTISNPKQGLLVVDGGWTQNADYVREVIEGLGGHVDAWILTHPHEDHIGAFNALYPNLEKITIDSVYTVDMASPDVCMKRASWDNVDAYKDFLALTIPELQYVHTGETLDLLGLKLDILNAFDERVETLSKDYINDGSMMFMVRGKTQSMLFCADVGKAMSDDLLKRWGSSLRADYLQMGHHGYGGLNDDFYEMAAPSAAFFDAPDTMMLDTTGKFDNPQHAALMEGMGAEVYSFHTAPNAVSLN